MFVGYLPSALNVVLKVVVFDAAPGAGSKFSGLRVLVVVDEVELVELFCNGFGILFAVLRPRPTPILLGSLEAGPGLSTDGNDIFKRE
jgi:hypothetical protein